MLTEFFRPRHRAQVENCFSKGKESWERLQSIHNEDSCDPTGEEIQMKLKIYGCLFRCQVRFLYRKENCWKQKYSRFMQNTQPLQNISFCLWVTLEIWQALGTHDFWGLPLWRGSPSTQMAMPKGVYYLSRKVSIKLKWFILTNQGLFVVHLGCRARCEPGGALGDSLGWHSINSALVPWKN